MKTQAGTENKKDIKKAEELMRRLPGKTVPILLTILFCFVSIISFSTILRMQGNARVINYTGIVRGATQRLVKQEMNNSSNDELIEYLNEILQELATGKGENGLNALPDKKFQKLIQEMRRDFKELVNEIENVRRDSDKDRLYTLSESYFIKADQAVSAAETYSEKNVKSTMVMLICLDTGFVVSIVLFWIYDRRQKKVQMALYAAESSNRAKSEFLSRMSHEIRTPMNGIIGMTAIARMYSDDRERLLDCLDKIDLSSEYLLALINDILDMSRIESGKIELEHRQFDLTEILDRIHGMFQQKAESRGIELLIKSRELTVTEVVGDNLRISQVLINIVSNALKFTPSGGQVTVEMRQKAVSREKAELEFVISDTGAGISEEFQARLFEPFEQEEAATARQYGGTGLGLAISHNFVELMGGEITVKSKPNEGSQFTVHLTLDRPQQQNLRAAETDVSASPVSDDKQPFDLRGEHILLAEDNEINAEIATILLESSGAFVDLAHNGREAVAMFEASENNYYPLILMDIRMPVMDGMDACRHIRLMKREDSDHVIIIGLSASAFQEDIDKAIESGMNGYIPKPIDTKVLIETISSML